MRILYFAQIQSILTYGIVAWGPMIKQSDLKSLQQIRDNCMRCICPKNPLAEIYETLCVLPVFKLIQLKRAKMGFRLCNDLLPLKWSEALLTDHRSVSITKLHKYGTRLKGIPNLPKASPTKYRKSFLCKAISVYNSLPTKLVQKKVTT